MVTLVELKKIAKRLSALPFVKIIDKATDRSESKVNVADNKSIKSIVLKRRDLPRLEER